MSNLLVNADSKKLPLEDESVQMCVTSPPYFGLRKYRTGDNIDEIGLESLHDCKGWVTGSLCGECYVCRTLAWTSEIKRVLRKDGLFFLNLGDSYNGSGGAGGDYNTGGLRDGQPRYSGRNINVLKPKDLIGIPWTVAFALRDYQGWWLRNEVIWWKRNAYPEGGAVDRFGREHEHIFVFSKSKKYFFDKFATIVPYEKELNRWGGEQLVADGVSEWSEDTGQPLYRDRDQRPNPKGKGRRTVWDIPTAGVSGGSHFAKYPNDLPKVCIEAGTSEHGCCSVCNAPYERIVERTFDGEYNDQEATKQQERMEGVISGGIDRVTLGRTEDVSVETVGWEPTCTCNSGETKPCIVLDPFVGSGTTLLAARELKRNAIGVDLSFHYLTNDAQERLGVNAMRAWEDRIEVSEEASKITFGGIT